MIEVFCNVINLPISQVITIIQEVELETFVLPLREALIPLVSLNR